MVELVKRGEYDAGAVGGPALRAQQEKGLVPEGSLLVFWSSPGFSRCCFTAQREIDDQQAQRITSAFISIDYHKAEDREVLGLEGCRAFVEGTSDGYDLVEAAA